MNENEKILVIGSEGFIGKYVCKELKMRGYEVISFDKKINPNQDTTTFNDEVANYSEFNSVNRVINLASLVGLKHCLDNPLNSVYQNVLGVTRLLEYFSTLSIPPLFIHISTWAVNGNLQNPYDVTKLAGEKMVLSYLKRNKLKGSVCRLGTTYGIGMSELGVIPSMLKKYKENKPLTVHGRGDQIRQFTYVEDTARGIVDVMEKGENKEIYNVVTDEVTSVKKIAELIGKNQMIMYEKEREYDEDYKILSNEKIKKLGWKPKMKFKDGVTIMMEDKK
jgi:dTDP-glucose 4,6-dehydratase